jgi:CHAT domain-containing protein
MNNQELLKQAQEMHTQAKKLSDVNPSLSFQLLEQCIAIYTQINYQNYEVLADCYLGMSTIQNEFRNTTKVLDYAYKALAICNNIKSEKLPVFKHDIYLQLAEGQIMNQNFDEAIHFTLKAYSLVDELADKEDATQEVYVKLGFCYGLKGLAQESIDWYMKALNLMKITDNQASFEKGRIYNNIAQAYYRLKNYKKTIFYRKAGLSTLLTLYGKHNTYTAYSYGNLSLDYLTDCQYDKALENVQMSLHCLCKDYEIEDIYAYPNSKQSISDMQIITNLLFKGRVMRTYYLEQTKQVQDADCAFNNFCLSTNSLLTTIQNVSDERNTTGLLNQVGRVFADTIDMAFILHYHYLYGQVFDAKVEKIVYLTDNLPDNSPLFKAFVLSEQSKGILLLSHLKSNEAQVQSGISPDLLEQEHQLHTQLMELDKQIATHQQLPIVQQNETEIAAIQAQKFDVHQQYQQLIALFEQKYPNYYQLKHNHNIVDVPTLQDELRKQVQTTALVEYFATTHNLFVFCITPYNYYAAKVSLPPNFDDLVADFNFYLTEGIAERKNYIDAAQTLYQLLMQPIEQYLQGIEQLIIIPDKELSTLPFEALLYEQIPTQTTFANLPYLLLRHAISYHYSATLWVNSAQIKTQNKPNAANSFVGFAPVYAQTAKLPDAEVALPTGSKKQKITNKTTKYTANAVRMVRIGDTDYQALLHSETEINTIAQLFEQQGQTTQIYLHEQATEQNFKQAAGSYRYIHIAAHGIYHPTKPELSSIVFAPNPHTTSPALLHLSDTYTLQLNADLVVLSCCQTGVGTHAIGEGVIALHRGFLYSGAKNVIYTLFKVYDLSSSQLTTALFREILNKHTYAEALQKAKLSLIKANKAPAHWAGFVLMG